jgi:GNAT superfamily N-acetyltransferase
MIPPFRTTFNRVTRELLSKRSRTYYYTWGVLSINPENPHHYDSNLATWEEVEKPEIALAEVERVYGDYGVTPRIRLTEYSTPDTLSDFLHECDYININEEETSSRIMRWTHAPVTPAPLPDGVTIRKANLEDLESLVRIQFEENNLMGDWAYRYLTYGLTDPRISYFLAEVEKVPVATVALGQTKTMALIDDVSTLSAYRGRGLAGLLMGYAQQHSRHDIMLEVITDNAQRVYERVGFKVAGTIMDSRWVHAHKS